MAPQVSYQWLSALHCAGISSDMAIAFSPSTDGPLAPWPRYPGPPHFINPGQPPAASYHGSPSSRAAAALSGRRARRLLRPPAPRHTRSYGSFVLVTVGRQGMRCSLRGCSAGGCIRKPVLVHCQRRYRDGAVALHYTYLLFFVYSNYWFDWSRIVFWSEAANKSFF